LSLGLLLLGAASGVLGVAGFFSDLQNAQGQASEALRATGSREPEPLRRVPEHASLSSVGFAWLRERAHQTSRDSPRARERGRSRRNRRTRDPSSRSRSPVVAVRSGIAFASGISPSSR
jgi:hypothetical protein